MRLALVSDLHLEFESWYPVNCDYSDVLILSGDILVESDLGIWDETQKELGFMTKRSERFHTFMQNCSNNFKHVLYVAGNHEHYHGDYANTLSNLKSKFSYLKNVHVLNNESIEIDNVVFFGGTLWTDMNKEDPLTLYQIAKMMNDFRCVKNSNRVVTFKTYVQANKPVGMTDEEFMMQSESLRTVVKFKEREATFCPEDAVVEHKAMLAKLSEVHNTLDPSKKLVVIGHHSPSKLSTHPRYADETIMNGGYSSDLSEFMFAHPKIQLWTHGHTHHPFDYMVGSCQVVCNPRGYAGYERPSDAEDPFYPRVINLV
jgi:predicted phosphodiesterase